MSDTSKQLESADNNTYSVNLSRDEFLKIRQALLGIVDLLERKLDMMPRTSQLRKQHKNALRHQKRVDNINDKGDVNDNDKQTSQEIT